MAICRKEKQKKTFRVRATAMIKVKKKKNANGGRSRRNEADMMWIARGASRVACRNDRDITSVPKTSLYLYISRV